MKYHRYGFTIVELIVVITVIALLASISTVVYTRSQLDSYANQANTMARIVASAAEKYYAAHQEYPSSTDLSGGATGALTDTQLRSAASALGVAEDVIMGPSTKDFDLQPCNQSSQPNCLLNTLAHTSRYVYYITRANAVSTSAIASSLYGTSCVITIASDTGSTAYAIAYYDPASKQWTILKSNHGTVSVSGGCSFS